MPKEDEMYHIRRERDHRAMAEAATTDVVKRVHLALAEKYAARLKAA